MNTIMTPNQHSKHNTTQKHSAAESSKKENRQNEEPPSRSKRLYAREAQKPGSASLLPKPQKPAAGQSDRRKPRALLQRVLDFFSKTHKKSAKKAKKTATVPAQTKWTPQEERILANIGELHAARVHDIMIPRADIEALELDTSLAEALRLFEHSGHSRMPVYAETLDDPRGMIHIRDILSYITNIFFSATHDTKDEAPARSAAGKRKNKSRKPADKAAACSAVMQLDVPIHKLGIVREVLFVPASMQAGRLLARMQASRTQMALVIDEHGGTDGLVSMEDVVELLVGDIEDEHDEDDMDIITEAQNSWIIDAATEIEDLKENLGIDFSAHPLAQEVDTVGGLIITTLDRIPARGEKVQLSPQYRVQILDADRRRIKRIRLNRLDIAAKP